MRDDIIIEKLKEGILRRSSMPADEWFADMVRRGIIDENGQVLVRMPIGLPTEEERRVFNSKPAQQAQTNGEAAPPQQPE